MENSWFERVMLPGIIVLGAALGGLMVFALSKMGQGGAG